MKTLDDLMFETSHTDKSYRTRLKNSILPTREEQNTGRLITHSYSNFYGPILNSKRNTVANFLEIGVWRGGSLTGWANYFDNANVYGIDNVNMFDINRHDGIHDISLPENATFICDDAYNPRVLEKHFSNIKFDVIIDDGPHTKESQLFTLNYFCNKMRKNGVIFIEDVGSWEPHESVCKYIYENFEGDKNCLSLIDRTRNPYHGWNEYILMYYIE